jgi:hypothetical protein
MSGMNLRLDHAGIAEVLRTQCRGIVDAAAASVVAFAEGEAPLVDRGRTRIPIDAAAQTTDRARAVVALKHPAGMAVQAKYGTLTRAAAAAGLEVNG